MPTGREIDEFEAALRALYPDQDTHLRSAHLHGAADMAATWMRTVAAYAAFDGAGVAAVEALAAASGALLAGMVRDAALEGFASGLLQEGGVS